jgi:hypothetical protein
MGPRLQLSRNGKIVGEYDLEKLRVMKDEGRIFPGDYLWMAGWADWKDALGYLGAQKTPAITEETSKPKRSRPKNQRQRAEVAAEAAETEGPEEQDVPPGEAKASSSDTIADKIGVFSCILMVLIFIGYGFYPSQTRLQRQAASDKTTSYRPPPKPRPGQTAKTILTDTTGVEAKKASPSLENFSFKGFGYDGKELFASSVLAYAAVANDISAEDFLPEDSATFYYEGSPQAAIALSGVRKGDRFQVTISGDRFIKASKFAFTAKKDDAFVEVGPNTIFDYEALSNLRQSVPFNITYTIQRGDEPARSESETWIARQINDCQTSCANLYLNNKGKITAKPYDASYSFAGYVNENHPWIDSLLKDALATGLCRAFSGYQEGEEGVVRQVNAIWTALQKRGISYSSIANFTASGGNSYQHVRFIDESITSSQANCIDGSVVMASVLRKIGLNVSIILVPGHAYLAVINDDDSEYLFAVETTMIGRNTLEIAIDYATDSGPQALNKIYEKLDDEKHPSYQDLNIREARKFGINPIPYSR